MRKKFINPGEKLEAGYVGRKDNLRDESRRLLKSDLAVDTDIPESYSSGDNTKARFYKKGGRIKPILHEHEGIPRHIQGKKVKRVTLVKAEKMKKGGRKSK